MTVYMCVYSLTNQLISCTTMSSISSIMLIHHGGGEGLWSRIQSCLHRTNAFLVRDINVKILVFKPLECSMLRLSPHISTEPGFREKTP